MCNCSGQTSLPIGPPGPTGPTGPAGSCTLINITYAQGAVLISNIAPLPKLIVGSFYKVTDRAGTGIVLMAETPNNFSLGGQAGFLNADYQAVGVYTSVPSFHLQKGVWYSTLVVVANDVVIYNNLHYKNLTGSIGTAPNGDSVNWVVLTQDALHGFIEEWDYITYDFTNDLLNSRLDRRGNFIQDNLTNSYGNISNSQWGNNKHTDNFCDAVSIFSSINNLGQVRGNRVTGNSQFFVSGQSGIITTNTLLSGSQLTGQSNLGSIQENDIRDGAILDGASQAVRGVCLSNSLSGTAIIHLGANAGIVQRNMIGGSSVLTTLMNIGIYFDTNMVLHGLTATFDPTVSQIGGKWEVGASTFISNLDMTANFSTGVLTIPTNLNYVGIFTLTGNTGQTITSIVNAPLLAPIKFVVANSLTQTFTATAIGSATANQIVSSDTSHIIVGRTNGTDFIETERSGTFNRIKLFRIMI